MAWIDWEGFLGDDLGNSVFDALNNTYMEEPYDYLRDKCLWQLMRVNL